MQQRPPAYIPAHSAELGDLDASLALTAIVENSFDGIYITDGNAKTILLNKSYEVISGLQREDLMGRGMGELVEAGVISASGTLAALQQRRPVTLDQTFKTGKHAIVTSVPILNQHNNIVMVVTNVRDITELHTLRQKLTQEAKNARRRQAEIEVIRSQLVGSDNIVAQDPAMIDTLLVASRVAGMDTIVLLLGETGVGKEMLATYIHQNSLRKNKNLIKVNCGAIPHHLVESELFGYAKGAFTGAQPGGKMGLFEAADKGTLFLDEIGELPLDIQVKLLRALQEGEIVRVGDVKPRKVDVRILAATNRDLQQMVQQGSFRQDLYYRISVFPITVPPLRHRSEDILPLANAMLSLLNRQYGLEKHLTPQAEVLLQTYAWPGNVRELRNIIERAVVLSTTNEILPQHLAISPEIAGNAPLLQSGQAINLRATLEQIEKEYILEAYKKYGTVRKAAQSLGLDAATYTRKRQKYTQQT